MYWQKRFEQVSPDAELEEKILEIRKEHPDYGYRRIHGELLNLKIKVNKKKVHRLTKKLSLQVTSFTRKSRKYSSYKGKIGKIAPNRLNRRFDTCIPHQKITTDTTEFKYYEIDSNGRLAMKKLYLDPDFEIVNIRLAADVLFSSSENEEEVGGGGSTPGGDEEFDDIDSF